MSSNPQHFASPQQRSSLRRLSSLANLHQFNPFTRRRLSHSTQTSSEDDPSSIALDQQTQAHQRRRQSYITLPEDPLPALPKSRTFSNLPLTRNRHGSKPRPSMGPPSVPPSRIPTPSASLNAKARLASATKSILKVSTRRGLVRSDTEPLLPSRTSSVTPPTSRVLKENLLLSPIEPTSRLDVPFDALNMQSPVPRQTTALRRLRTPNSISKRPQTPGTNPVAATAAITTKGLQQPNSLQAPNTPISSRRNTMQSSGLRIPAATTSKPRRQTMLPPVNALQPLCTNKPQRSSFSSDIQSRHLLSPRAAPTPPPLSCPRPSATYLLPDSATSNISVASEYVTQSQSTAYWSGRLMSQFDRDRTENLQLCLALDEPPSTYPHVDLHRCLKELQKKCVTDAAKLSFAIFKAKVYVTAGIVAPNKGMAESGDAGDRKDSVEA